MVEDVTIGSVAMTADSRVNVTLLPSQVRAEDVSTVVACNCGSEQVRVGAEEEEEEGGDTD